MNSENKLATEILKRMASVATACKVMVGFPGQTEEERRIWKACSEQIDEALCDVVPDYKEILKRAEDEEAREKVDEVRRRHNAL